MDELDVDVPQEDTQVVEISPAEKEAAQYGWLPEDQYKGDPKEWRDAEAFLRRGQEINGFLRKDLERLKADNLKKSQEMAKIQQVIAEFQIFHNETEERAYKRAFEDLKNEKINAIELGEGSKVVAIEEQIERLKEAQKVKPQPKVPEAPSYDADYTEWIKTNAWYLTDPGLKELAELFGSEINAKYPEKRGREFYDEVALKVKEAAPYKFENPNRRIPSVSNSSDTRVPVNTSKRTYANLPPESKAACDDFVSSGLIKSREAYCAQYQWD